ncbi:uncharacterized protein [Panulirus ornatus]|uniref:uncharacterized protein isoform X2 n=1 Tax=Panulirus ornatus TaxID=150431 RepID=UPI003A844B96
MSGSSSQRSGRVVPRVRMWAWACACLLTVTPTVSFTIPGTEEPQPEGVVEALNRMVQVLETRERHTELYERVALLEEMLNKKTETEVRLETEMVQLRAKIPALEEEIETIPEMKKDLAEFEAKIEKLVHDYEAKLSTLASEVIRLKKYGARRKDMLTLSDGTDVLLRTAPSCPEVVLGMVAERVGEQCLYFYFASQFNWTSAHQHCQKLGGDLAAPQDLVPLKTFLHQDFVRGPSLWLGASYDLDDEEVALDPSAAPDAEAANGLLEEKRGASRYIPNLDVNLQLYSNALEEDEDGSSSEQDAAGVSEPPGNMLLDDGRRNILLGDGPSNMLLDDGPSDMDDGPSNMLLGDGPSDILLDDGPSNLLLNAGSTNMLLEDSGSILLSKGAGNLRRILDQAAMFDKEDTGDSGSLTIPRSFLKPRENTLNKVDGRETPGKKRIRDASVVDFILLSDPAPSAEGPSDQNLPEYSNLEERSVPGNLTAADVLVEDVNGTSAEAGGEGTAPGDDVGGQEPPEDVEEHEAKDTKGAKKATMKCILLQQKESLEYELTGRPCDELHNFVCDMKFTFDNLLRE